MTNVQRYTIFADYFQFIVQDENSQDDFGALWNKDAANLMVAAGKTAIGLGTLRNVDVAVEVHVLDEQPGLSLADCDHVVEGAFSSPTGKIVVMGCTDYFPDAARIEIAPGTYCFLYVVSGVGTIEAEWEPADDLYSIFIWPGDARELRALKHWKPE